VVCSCLTVVEEFGHGWVWRAAGYG
jgi:hypothetical protein